MDPERFARYSIKPSADHVRLAAVGAPKNVSGSILNGAMSSVTAWRVVEMWSEKNLPFEAEVKWSGADAGGLQCLLTVSGRARVCIAAAGISQITFTNLCDEAHECWASVATTDSAVTTENHWMISRTGGGIGLDEPIEVSPPPYGTELRIDAADPTALAGTTVNLFDGLGQICASYALNAEPLAVPIVGIRVVQVIPVATVRYRLDFRLGV